MWRSTALLCFLCLTLVPHLAARAEVPAQTFTLGQYVPSDAWLYVHGVYNPEARFAYDYWDRLLQDVSRCGIDEELRLLFLSGHTDPQARAEASQLWDEVMSRLRAVDWSQLFEREMAFAERLVPPVPDIILLCRPSPNYLEPGWLALNDLFRTLARVIDCARVVEQRTHGVWVSTLMVDVPGLELHLLRHEGVIGFILGRSAIDEVTRMLAGSSSIRSIAQSPRFIESSSLAPTPEDGIMFMDFKLFFENLRAFPNMIEELDPETEHPTWRKVALSILDACDVIDVMLTSSSTEGLKVRSTDLVKLQPSAKDKPLLRALTAGKPVEKFDRFVPHNAKGFTVSSGVDFGDIYQQILVFVEQTLPDGAEALKTWERLQDDWGFHLQRDVFSWLATENLSVSLAPSPESPSNQVMFFRVTDARLASLKINSGLDRIQQKFGISGLTIRPADQVDAEGFREVGHVGFGSLLPIRPCVGVYEDWLVIGSSPQAINPCLAAAEGAPRFSSNARFLAEGVLPTGPVVSASFSDLSTIGEELGAIFFGIGTAGGVVMAQVPEADRAVTSALMGIPARLGPVFTKIDFLSSSSSVTTFDPNTLCWRTEQTLTYKPPKSSGVSRTKDRSKESATSGSR